MADRAVPTALEANGFRLINQLPGFLGPAMLGVMQLGALGAVPVFALIALLGRRVRCATAADRRRSRLGRRTDPAAAGRRRPSDRAYPRRAAAGRPQCRAGLSGDPCCGGGRACHRRPGRAEPASPPPGLAGRRPGRYRAGLRRRPPAHRRRRGSRRRLGRWSSRQFAVGVTPNVPDEIQLRAALARSGRPDAGVRPVGINRQGVARFLVEERGDTHLIKAVGRDDPEADWLRRAWQLVAFAGWAASGRLGYPSG